MSFKYFPRKYSDTLSHSKRDGQEKSACCTTEGGGNSGKFEDVCSHRSSGHGTH